MIVRLRGWLADLLQAFWLLPSAMVVLGIALGQGLVETERLGLVPDPILRSLYNGGETGARTLLGAIASSTIGVAGTVFSITIAALTLAAGQMGPRLLSNFTSDRGNQATLGLFLATFSYALIVLQSVRGAQEGRFIPHLAVGGGLLLAFGCVAMLIYFVHHVAGRINVDTVINLVADDLGEAVERLAPLEAPARARLAIEGDHALCAPRSGYIQRIDDAGLARFLAAAGIAARLTIKPGDFITARTPIGTATAARDGLDVALDRALIVGGRRSGAMDIGFPVRQLVEVAVRALSPGVNDPQTAIGALDRLGSALCLLARRHLPGGAFAVDGRAVLVRDTLGYAALVDAMFGAIRQNARGSAEVLGHMLDTLEVVSACEPLPERLAELRRHADLVAADAARDVPNASDRARLAAAHARQRPGFSGHTVDAAGRA